MSRRRFLTTSSGVRDVLASSIASVLAVGSLLAPRHVLADSGAIPPRYAAELKRERETARRLWEHQRQRLALAPVAERPAGVVPVTSCADDGSDGTLRAVLLQAVDGDIIDMSALTCGTIMLVEGTLVTIVDVTLQGPGRDLLSIDAGGQGSIVYAQGPHAFVVNDLTMRNAYAVDSWGGCIQASSMVTLNRAALRNCAVHEVTTFYGASFGGALSAREINLVDSEITGSTASSEATWNPPSIGEVAGGAALSMYDITVTRSTLSGNRAIGTTTDRQIVRGGALATVVGAITLIDSIVADNRVENASVAIDRTCAYSSGGGIDALEGLTIERTSIVGNVISAPDAPGSCGGGAYVRVQPFISTASTISGNVSSGTTGGVHARERVFLYDTTISGNSASKGPGGLYAELDPVLSAVTIAFNQSQNGPGGAQFFNSITLKSSLIANNISSNGFHEISVPAGTIDGNHNLIMDAGDVAVPPDTLSSDPMLLPLADNGGPTMTHSLAERSPAIDAGSNDDALDYDQRGLGFPRVFGPAADIGAFEAQFSVTDEIFSNGFDE